MNKNQFCISKKFIVIIFLIVSILLLIMISLSSFKKPAILKIKAATSQPNLITEIFNKEFLSIIFYSYITKTNGLGNWLRYYRYSDRSKIYKDNANSSNPVVSPTITIANPASSTTITRKVMVIDFNPIIESQGSKRLREVYNWQDPVNLEMQYIEDVKKASGNYLQYQIVERIPDLDMYPTKIYDYVFTDAQYLSAVNSPDVNAKKTIDYLKILNDYDVCNKINNGEVDELWLWGGPWFGYYEAAMVGPTAFFTNSPPILNSSCIKNAVIMGFSYERGVSEMLEDLGHAIEGVLSYKFNEDPRFTVGNYYTAWGQFALSDKISPGKSGCGWMHFTPNSHSDYDWENITSVTSTCEDWLNYPNLSGATTSIDCNNWGCDGYQYKKWWFSHLPKADGMTNGFYNNWWKYIGELDLPTSTLNLNTR